MPYWGEEQEEEEEEDEEEDRLEQAEEIGHLPHDNLATARTLFTLSLSPNVLLFDQYFCWQPFDQCEPDDEPSWFETVTKLR